MKQSLQLGISQQLTMTPQLQQAIKLLQLSTLDLQQEIQQALDSNIMLEVEEEQIKPSSTLTPDNADRTHDKDVEQTNIELAIIDDTWDDAYENQSQTKVAMTAPLDFAIQQSQSRTLQTHLIEQLELSTLSLRDHAIAIAIIDAINPKGYLTLTQEELYQGLTQQLDYLELDELNAVLHRIQNFEPIGIGAIDLSDCLRLQLLALSPATAYRENALKLVENHLDLLAAQEKSKLIKQLNISEHQLKQVIALIRSLDPEPGIKIANANLGYIVADIFVNKINGQWRVKLNPDIAPKLRVNTLYSGMIKRADNSQDNTQLKDHLQEAKWFIKSLQGRNETLLRVAQLIVEKQTEFLEHGAVAMKPMILKNIAEDLELHESTISRVTTQKYMHTPNGIVEFKYFFSSHVATVSGGECSATAIRAVIKEFIANEHTNKPLSDEKISILLKEKGIKVARRTVAKYRESMSIASSSQRKRLI
jgi:RNA polymerase sigma-54 factor